MASNYKTPQNLMRWWLKSCNLQHSEFLRRDTSLQVEMTEVKFRNGMCIALESIGQTECTICTGVWMGIYPDHICGRNSPETITRPPKLCLRVPSIPANALESSHARYGLLLLLSGSMAHLH